MATEVPMVRHFLSCLEVIVELGGGGRDFTLRRLIQSVNRLPGEPFPIIREQMALFASLANGRGEHEFTVELVFLDQGEEHTVARPLARRVDLGQDPTMVHGLPIPLRNVVFHQPGQYTFYLVCDELRIAEAHVLVR